VRYTQEEDAQKAIAAMNNVEYVAWIAALRRDTSLVGKRSR